MPSLVKLKHGKDRLKAGKVVRVAHSFFLKLINWKEANAAKTKIDPKRTVLITWRSSES